MNGTAFSVAIAGPTISPSLVAGTVPRLLTRLLTPGKTYRLYGVHFTIQRLVSGWSNFPAFHLLCGDSVLITGYLRLLGYRLGKVEQELEAALVSQRYTATVALVGVEDDVVDRLGYTPRPGADDLRRALHGANPFEDLRPHQNNCIRTKSTSAPSAAPRRVRRSRARRRR